MESEKIKCNSCKCYRTVEEFDKFKTCVKCRQKRQQFKKQNRDKVLEEKKRYRDRHKEEIALKAKAYQQEVYLCPFCNYDVKKCNKYRHEKSKTHLNNVILGELEEIQKPD